MRDQEEECKICGFTEVQAFRVEAVHSVRQCIVAAEFQEDLKELNDARGEWMI